MALGACAYGIDGSIQEVQFLTPGAQNAACDVYVDRLRYRVKPPRSLDLFKSGKTLIVDCKAPGNRRKTINIEPQIEPSTAWNVANGGAGVAWDYASGALFRYPDVIEVDFSDTPITQQQHPAHNNPNLRQPGAYNLEEFLPDSPRLNADKNATPLEILRRESLSVNTYGEKDAAASIESNTMSNESKKASPMDMVQGLEDEMNPSQDRNAVESEPLLEQPTPLFPYQ